MIPHKTMIKYVAILLAFILVVCYVLVQHSIDSMGTPQLEMPDNIDILYQKGRITDTILSTNSIKQNNAASGVLYTGRKYRKFIEGRRKFDNKFIKPNTFNFKRTLNCVKWGVLTSIFKPSEAVRQFLFLHNWCVVVVGDVKSPPEYYLYSSRSNVLIYLSIEDQQNLQSAFVNSIPLGNYGRKNVGYIYAILHGAEVIWDFDDDNMLKFWMEGAATNNNLWIESFLKPIQSKISVSFVQKRSDSLFFNPYPYLGSPNAKCWPRGYPLSLVNDTSTIISEILIDTVIENKRIAILQSLADHQPDVDAVYRMTYKTPFNFKLTNVTNPLVLPHGIYSPLNAQASLHFKAGFFALFLPVTVHGRVSDIWRSYIAQTLFSLVGLHVGFLPRPLVHQNRNPHSYEADFQAEIPLYLKTISLVKFLDSWRNKIVNDRKHEQRSHVDLMENLYIELYERGFVEEQDVKCVQLWIELIAQISPLTNHTGINPLSVPLNWTHKPVGKQIVTNKTGNVAMLAANKSLTFWTSDLHDGTRIDIPSLLSFLGQTTFIAGIKGNASNYPNVLKMPGIHIVRNMSSQIRTYNTHSMGISDAMIEQNVKFYKDNKMFRKVNAVFCSFPSSMCELFMPFNQSKSILFIAAHRYNLGRCNEKSWSELNSKLRQLHEMSRGHRRHVIGANNRYDLEYLRYYTGIEGLELVSSFSWFYTQSMPMRYTQKYDELLVYYQSSLPSVLSKITAFKYVHLRQKYRRYTLQDLSNHRGFILFPYSVMCYKTTELYSLNIPMFVPSLTYFKQNGGLGNDRTVTSPFYCCKNKSCKETLEKIPKHINAYHSYNPNVYFADYPDDEMYWLQFSDFYEWPHIQYFDNATDLEQKVLSTDFLYVHNKMKEENEIRKTLLLNQWTNIINDIKQE